MSEKYKVCAGCKSIKNPVDFSHRAVICKVCEADTSIQFDLKCSNCKTSKPRECFTLVERCCKECISVKNRERRTKAKARSCKVCEILKPVPDYRKGLEICKECEAKQTSKVCVKCNIDKPIDMFRVKRTDCKDCERNFGKTYRREKPEKATQWIENNKERMAELQKNTYEKNKPKIRAKEQERIATDPVFKQIKNYRRNMLNVFHGKAGVSKNVSLLCTSSMFQKWLEDNFEEEMTLDNHADFWQIDHVVPLELLYETTDNKWCYDIFAECKAVDCLFAWYNTQPMKKRENRTKGHGISYEAILAHLKRVNTFMLKNDIEPDETFFKYREAARKTLDFMTKRPSQKRTTKLVPVPPAEAPKPKRKVRILLPSSSSSEEDQE